MLQEIPQSYLYGQFADDADLKATRDAYNQVAQEVFSWMQTTAIADYRTDPVSGQLLTFVALGLYNMPRRIMDVTKAIEVKGGMGNVPLADVSFSDGEYQANKTPVIILTDDQLRRSITWNLYSGDGWTFSTIWLRRRIARFLFGANGYDLTDVGLASQISIAWTGLREASITINGGPEYTTLASILKVGLDIQYLQTPIGYSFSVTLNSES